MSDSVQPHRWQPTRLLNPWDSPGKNTGVGCHFLLQCTHACILSCFSHVRLCAIPWTAVHQAPLSMELSRQEYWSGLPCPSLSQYLRICIIATVFQSNPFDFSFSIFNPHIIQMTQFSTVAKSMGLWSQATNSILILNSIQIPGLLSITVWSWVRYYSGKLFSASVRSLVKWEQYKIDEGLFGKMRIIQDWWGTNGINR